MKFKRILLIYNLKNKDAFESKVILLEYTSNHRTESTNTVTKTFRDPLSTSSSRSYNYDTES